MFSPVRCVALDAVGTLIFPDPPVAEVYARVGRQYGSQLTPQQVRVRFHEAFRAECQGAADTSEEEERERWRRIVRRVFDWDDRDSCFEELFAHFGRAESWRCFPDVADTIGELLHRGYDLVLASNFDRRLHAICDGHAELRPFSVRVISSEVGTFKPQRRFYQSLLELSGRQCNEVLMVGDDWENDIWGALEVAMPAIFLDRAQTESLTSRDNVPVISSLRGLLDFLP